MRMQWLPRLNRKSVNAWSAWRPHRREQENLKERTYFQKIGRVDQIWQWLQKYHGDLIAVKAPHAINPETFTFKELSDKISCIASSLRDLGIGRHDVVALFAENSPRWLLVDQAIMRLDACNAVRGASAPSDELRYIIQDSGATALVVQSVDVWNKLALSESECQKLRFILLLEGESLPGLVSWNELLERGREKVSPEINTDRSIDSAKQTTATILYTSGTTGKPKGVPLTHGNLLHQINSLACIANPKPGSPVLSVLPIWHSYERSAEYYFFSCGCTQSYTTIKYLKQDLPVVRPVVMATVPRLWEAIQIGFEDALKSMSPNKQKILRFLLSNSSSYKKSLRFARQLLVYEVPFVNRTLACFELSVRWPLHVISSTFLWPKILNKLCGGRLKFPINGGGAIPSHVDSFFESLGIELLVGYGLTETSPVISCRRPWRNVRGSSGSPLPNTEVRIVDPDSGKQIQLREQGRILVRGPQVMQGYLDNPEATNKAIDSNGWFDTGDLGMILKDGSLVLTGRAKDTIVLSTGENIEPGPLEETLLSNPLFEQVMLVGQDQRQLGVLIVPKIEHLLSWANEKGLVIELALGQLQSNSELKILLRSEINKLLSKRKGARSEERVVGIAFVEQFSIENGLLTQTLKQRRQLISERDKDSIHSIFS